MNKIKPFSIISAIMPLMLLSVGLTQVAQAQPDPCDPDLRLWLKADDLAAIQDGNSVLSWTDASSYGTIMTPRVGFEGEAPIYRDLILKEDSPLSKECSKKRTNRSPR